MTQQKKLIEMIKSKGFFRLRDLTTEGISRSLLPSLVESGLVEKVSWGTYRYSDLPISKNHGLVIASLRVDGSIICLLSALSFHGLTTHIPSATWIGIRARRANPKVDYPPIETTFMSSSVLNYGTEVHLIEKIPVRITTPAKTVADCFKYHSKVGLDLATEALRNYWEKEKGSINDLLEAAKITRATKLMRPYLRQKGSTLTP